MKVKLKSGKRSKWNSKQVQTELAIKIKEIETKQNQRAAKLNGT